MQVLLRIVSDRHDVAASAEEKCPVRDRRRRHDDLLHCVGRQEFEFGAGADDDLYYFDDEEEMEFESGQPSEGSGILPQEPQGGADASTN